jgi:hypothetical protein
MNHDRLAYPLIVSVPTLSGILLLINYFESGGLCNQIFLKQLVSRLGIVINVDNFIFSDFDIFSLIRFLILLVEACIRLKENWKVITKTVIYTICWCKRRNTVDPSTYQPSSDMLHLASYLNPYKVGAFLLLALSFAFLEALYQKLNYNMIVVVNLVFADFAMLGLSIYWVISSEDICTFIQLKYNQRKYSLGFY